MSIALQMRDDEEGLEKAFRAAVENPIDRFIRTFPTPPLRPQLMIYTAEDMTKSR